MPTNEFPWDNPAKMWTYTYQPPVAFDFTKSFTVGLLIEMLTDAVQRARSDNTTPETELVQFLLMHHLKEVKI